MCVCVCPLSIINLGFLVLFLPTVYCCWFCYSIFCIFWVLILYLTRLVIFLFCAYLSILGEGGFIFILCVWKFAWIYISASWACSTLASWKSHQIPWMWSCIYWWAAMCMLGTRTGSSARTGSALNHRLHTGALLQLVECLSSMQKALDSIPSSAWSRYSCAHL